jgi:hypothetical protein
MVFIVILAVRFVPVFHSEIGSSSQLKREKQHKTIRIDWVTNVQVFYIIAGRSGNKHCPILRVVCADSIFHVANKGSFVNNTKNSTKIPLGL